MVPSVRAAGRRRPCRLAADNLPPRPPVGVSPTMGFPWESAGKGRPCTAKGPACSRRRRTARVPRPRSIKEEAMKLRFVIAAALIALGAGTVQAETAKTKAAGAKPAMDPKAMQEMMMKAAALGPQHELFKKLEGEWDLVVKSSMDPSQPPTETKSKSTIRTLMDGRYCQEETSGDFQGMPFTGMGLTGYDNVLKKYVSIWIDNMATGIMTSQGTVDATGKVITWTGESSDPMTGKPSKMRMVTRITDDDHHTFEMYGRGADGKEMKMMEIIYTRRSA